MIKSKMPQKIYHYYEKKIGPFINLSDLPLEKANMIMDDIRQKGDSFVAQRTPDYLVKRFMLKDKARELFISKGGKPERLRPHYLTLGSCMNEFKTLWFKECKELEIPLSAISSGAVSFTYGDLFPCMYAPDNKPWRRQVYTLEEIESVVEKYGLPQEWNPDGKQGIVRYIEAQLWIDVENGSGAKKSFIYII